MQKIINKKEISMKNLSIDERRNILLDYQIMSSKDVIEKHNISRNTLNHVQFFHGNSTAKARGYYYKDLLTGFSNPIVNKMRELKIQGKNSIQVAQILKLSLEKVNKMYSSIRINDINL